MMLLVNIFLEIPVRRKKKSEIPPIPNSVNAPQPAPKQQIKKIDTERMQGKKIKAKQEVNTTIYDAKV